MSYFKTCPRCGLHLDPGEQCVDCSEKVEQKKSAARSAGTLRTAQGVIVNHDYASSVMHHAGGCQG